MLFNEQSYPIVKLFYTSRDIDDNNPTRRQPGTDVTEDDSNFYMDSVFPLVN